MWNRVRDFIRSRPLEVAGVLGGLSLALLVALIVALAGGNGDSTPGAAAESTTTTIGPLPSDGGPETTLPADDGEVAPVDRNPLTGEPLGAPAAIQIIAVKVDNGPSGKPQIGLNQAEMLMETPVEGGLTRFTALFFENRPALVGPVRSMRSYDADLLASFDPLFVTIGGQDSVYRAFRGAGIEIVDQTEAGVFQSLERPVPSHLMATMEVLAELATGGLPVVPPVAFGADFAGGPTAGRIEIPFSAATLVEYRFEDGRYHRYENGESFEIFPTFDGDPVPLEVDTIVVQFAAQRSAGYNDSAGADVLTFDVIGFGRALVFHQGEAVEGRWQRGAQEDPTVLTDAAGDSLELPPGVIMWTIVPRSLDVTFE